MESAHCRAIDSPHWSLSIHVGFPSRGPFRAFFRQSTSIFSRQMLAGERPTIFGDGTKTRDYVYVDDIVAANLLAMTAKRASGRSYNLGLGREVSDRQIFESVRRAVGATVEPILVSKRPGEIDRICLDASLAKAELGWEPTVSLEEGIARTVAFYRG